jgi:hypothetical protein
MAKFTAFDQTMDMSAVLAIMCEAGPFVTSGAAVDAKTVRSNVRNKWAHCNFSDWTKPEFMDAFRDMHFLVKKMNLPPADEQALCDDLDSWKDKGSLYPLKYIILCNMLILLCSKEHWLPSNSRCDAKFLTCEISDYCRTAYAHE